MLSSPRHTSWLVLSAGISVMALSMGFRITFGLFLQPVSDVLGTGREMFALALAVQIIVWGIAQPLTGILAERFGSGRVIAAGGFLASAGLWLTATATGPGLLIVGLGLLVGVGLSCGFGVILGVVSRAVPHERRTLAAGIVTSGASLGQVIFLPFSQYLIATLGYQDALRVFAVMALLQVPLAWWLVSPPGATAIQQRQPIFQAMALAGKSASFWLLCLGFGVCGFQTIFIGSHLPAYLVDQGLTADRAAFAMTMIPLANMAGAYCWGRMADWIPKKWVLCILYAFRTSAIVLFLVLPISHWGVIVFSLAVGFTWLGTVPLTSGLLGHLYGVRYLSTLFGFTYIGHQIGGFLGSWLGGFVFDRWGSYDLVWMIAVLLGLLTPLIHWPIQEKPLQGPTQGSRAAIEGRSTAMGGVPA